MTATNGHPHARTPADHGPTRRVLLRDDRGRLTLRRLRLWHRLLARCTAARLDRELAAGASPETSPALAARAIQLTSMRLRRDLAASVHRILTAAGEPPAVIPSPAADSPPPRLPLCRARIRQSAGLLAQLAGHLAVPGPVPARGVAMASQLLADGTGPLYRQACGEDLCHILHTATRALTL
jgi:hypothetical protein